jgi:hypothetical protein
MRACVSAPTTLGALGLDHIEHAALDFGRFAAIYRREFGELPSATFARAQRG